MCKDGSNPSVFDKASEVSIEPYDDGTTENGIIIGLTNPETATKTEFYPMDVQLNVTPPRPIRIQFFARDGTLLAEVVSKDSNYQFAHSNFLLGSPPAWSVLSGHLRRNAVSDFDLSGA